MIPTFIILFREILEISIILSIIMAATRGIAGRGRWVLAGVGGGLVGSAVVAYFAGSISNAIEGMGQEVFNAGVLFIAVLMIGWTVIWMQTHAREMVQKIKQVGQAVHDGSLPLYALATVVCLSMWREGAEIVLFMTGIITTRTETLFAIGMGGLAGALSAGTIGLMLYLGLVKFSTRYLFSTTSWLLTLLACGMSAQAAGFLSAADILPTLAPQLWDSSALLSETSILGKILHAMLGYSERPSGIQGVFYVATLLTIMGLLKMTQRKKMAPKLAGAAAVLLSVTAFHDAHAFYIKSPYVEQGVLEVENKNRFDMDKRPAENGFRQHVIGVGYGFTSWWSSELNGEWEKEAGHGYKYTATEIENTFQFTEQGEYLIDVGGLLSYEFSHEQGGADKVEAGILLGKKFTDWTHLANIIVEQEVGDHKNANPEYDVKWQTLYNYSSFVNPGVEYYGEFGEVTHSQGWDAQKHRFGPVIAGKLGHGVEYNIGWLFGISNGASDNAIKLNLEYELPM